MRLACLIFVLVVALGTAACAQERSSSYTDPIGDIDFWLTTANGTLDIVGMEVSNTLTDISFKLTVNGNVNAATGGTDWGKFVLGIATQKTEGTLTGNGWGRPINLSYHNDPFAERIIGMNHWIGAWVDGSSMQAPIGGSEFYSYNNDSSTWTRNASTWDAGTYPYPYTVTAGAESTLQWSFPLSLMDLIPGDIIYFDAYSSGGGGDDSAIDSLANPHVSVTSWSGPYASYATAAGGPGVNAYTVFGQSTAIHVDGGTTQAQTAAGYPLISGVHPVEKTGAGTLVLDQANTLASTVNIRGGTVRLDTATALLSGTLSPFASGTVSLGPHVKATVAGLTANAGGLVDVGTGVITVAAAGLSTSGLTTALAKGFAGGTWTGSSGIVSSAAAASLAAGIPRTIGWLDRGDGSIAVGFAAPGDTNLDWMIDMLDVAALIGSDKFGTGAAAAWRDGDCNYDGMLDILDVAGLMSTVLYDAGNYNMPTGLPGVLAPVPEPSGCHLMAACGIALAAAWRQTRGAPPCCQ